MENAYTIAMEIADTLSVKKYISLQPGFPVSKHVLGKTWKELCEKYPDSETIKKLKEDHQEIFQTSYEILSAKKSPANSG